MSRTRALTTLILIAALAAAPASAQPAKPAEQPQPNAPAGAAPGTFAMPRTVINNTFNPTGPTGTGTFNPTAQFFVCADDDGVAKARSTGMMGMSGMMGGMMSGGARHIEGRIAFLKAELKITDAQLPLWNAVAAAMRDQARDQAKAMPAMPGHKMTGTLPERLAAQEKMTAARLDAVRKLKTAVEPLYAALTAEQKKMFDELTADLGGGLH